MPAACRAVEDDPAAEPARSMIARSESVFVCAATRLSPPACNHTRPPGTVHFSGMGFSVEADPPLAPPRRGTVLADRKIVFPVPRLDGVRGGFPNSQLARVLFNYYYRGRSQERLHPGDQETFIRRLAGDSFDAYCDQDFKAAN